MKISLPTPDQAKVIARGKAEAPARFSQALLADGEKTAKLFKTFSATCGPLSRQTTRLDQSHPHQFYMPIQVGASTQAKLLTDVQLDPDDDAYILASLCDTLGQAIPIRLALSYFNSFFSTLVTKEQADTNKLYTLDVPPDTIPGPTQEGTEPAQASMERLEWPGNDDNDDELPVIATHTLLFPVPPGMHVPDTIDIKTHTFPEGIEWATIATWGHGLRYIFTKNDGHSVTTGGPLFDPTTFQDHPFGTPIPIRDIVLPSGDDFKTLCAIQDCTKYNMVVDSVTALTNGIYYYLGAQREPTTPTGAAAVTPQSIRLTLDSVNFKTPPSKADKEHETHVETVIAKYEIAFASIDPTTSTILPAKVTEPFKDILSKNKTPALRLAKEYIVTQATAAVSKDNKFAAYTNLKQEHMTPGLLQCFRNYQLNMDLPTLHMTRFQTQASPANLLPLDNASITYREICVTHSEEVLGREYTSKEIEDQSRKPLYFGRLKSVDDAISMTVNTFILEAGKVTNFEQSVCYTKIKEYIDLLLSPPVKDWRAAFEDTNPSIKYVICQDIIAMFAHFYAVGNHPDNVRAYKANQELPKNLFDMAILCVNQSIKDLTEAVNRSRLGAFADLPKEFAIHLGYSPGTDSHKRSNQADTDSSPDANKRQRGGNQKTGTGSPPKGAPKQADKKQQAADENAKKLGLLCHEGTDTKTLPFINIRAKKTANAKTKEQVCAYFMTQGWACAQGKDCKRPHIARLDQLDPTNREKLIQFIADPKNKYSWAPGKEPAPGNN
jgi:hypothetical protein